MVQRHIASYFWVNINKCRRKIKRMHLNYNNQVCIKKMFSSYTFTDTISMSCILLQYYKEKSFEQVGYLSVQTIINLKMHGRRGFSGCLISSLSLLL